MVELPGLTIGGSKSNLRSSNASANGSRGNNTRNDMYPSSNVSLSSNGEKLIQGSKSSNDPAIELCINIGKALKKIDRGLFQEWISWCNGLISFNSAIAMWDFFEPMACDV